MVYRITGAIQIDGLMDPQPPLGKSMVSWLFFRSTVSLIVVGWLIALSYSGAMAETPVSVLLTADTEGQVLPCLDCPERREWGGLARRATMIRKLRQQTPALLLDAGNFLFGGESMASGGNVMVAAYNALGYDAVNLSYRDFRLGKGQTLAVLQEAKFAVLSANLLDEKTGQPLAKPYVVKNVGGQRVALMGVTEAPGTRRMLPHLKKQLAGIRVQPPLEALAQWLPQARAEAPRVLLLYYGSVGGLKAIQEKFAGQLSAILVGGLKPDYLPTEAKPPMVGARPNGTHVAQVRLSGPPKATRAEVTQVALEPQVESDPQMEKIVAPFLGAKVPPEPTPEIEVRPVRLEPGKTRLVDRTGQNRAVRLTIGYVSLLDRFGKYQADPGRQLLVVQTNWKNIIPLKLVGEKKLPTKYQIEDLHKHLHLVVNGEVARLHPNAAEIPGHVAVEPLELEGIGSTEEGNVVFEAPAGDIEQLELVFFDSYQGPIYLDLLGAPRLPARKLVGPLQRNRVMEAGIYGIEKYQTRAGHQAPQGMTFIAVDLRARSVYTTKKQEGETTIEEKAVITWKEARKYTQLVADGEFAYLPHELSTLPATPFLMPDRMTGGILVFLGPEKASSLELKVYFPGGKMPDGEEISPESLAFLLEGEPPSLPTREALTTIPDDTLQVAILQCLLYPEFAGARAKPGESLLAVDVSVANTGQRGETFQTEKQLFYATTTGDQVPMDPASRAGLRPAYPQLWIPPFERRTFQVIFRISEQEQERPRLFYNGLTTSEEIDLKLALARPPEPPTPKPPPPVEPPPLVTSETEPNDGLEQANDLKANKRVQGLFQTEGDKDWYRLEVTTPGKSVLHVELTGVPGVYSRIRLCQADGEELKEVDAEKEGGSSSLIYLNVTPGRYYVLAWSAEGQNTREKYLLKTELVSLLEEPAPLLEETKVSLGFNLALNVLGGKLESYTSQEGPSWAARHLHDHNPIFYTEEPTHGWCSTNNNFPQDIVFSFYQGREATVQAVVIDTRLWERDKHKGFYIEGEGENVPQHVEVWLSKKSAADGFERIAGARLQKRAAEQVITFPPTRARYVKLRILSNYGGDYAELGEVKVIEARETGPSIVEDLPRNIALPVLEGAVVRFTSVGDHKYPHYLVDPTSPASGWASKGKHLPQEIVFAFRADQVALIDRIVLNPRSSEDPATRPKEVKILVSTETPFDGFEEVGTFTISQTAVGKTFPIQRRARFVKLQILKNYGGNLTSLGKVKIFEGSAPDYKSVLLDPLNIPEIRRVAEMGPPVDETDLAQEAESNNSPATANLLELNRRTRGTIDPMGEKDYFKLSIPQEKSKVDLELLGRPHIRTSFTLLDEAGRVHKQFDPGRRPSRKETLSWALKPGMHLLEVKEPPTYIVLIWDTSFSMEGKTDDLRQAVEAYLEQVRPNARLNLIRFSDDVEVLLPEFTSDRQRLKAATQGKFISGGRTSLYDAIAKGLELLEKFQGNRGIIVMSDGIDNYSTDYDNPGIWKILEKKRIRLYTIGLGWELGEYRTTIASSGYRFLGHLALATNGRFFFAGTSEELKGFYQQIAEELMAPPTYYLRATLGKGLGRLSVGSTGERLVKTYAPRIELILDASGSMKERKKKIDGRLKIQVAKEVLTRIIRELPDDIKVGLRFFGHRIKEGKSGDCQDSELVVPLGRINKLRLLEKVRQTRALGTTPLAYSLALAAEDFGDEPGEKLIVMVTDGKEECGGSPPQVVSDLVRRGLNVRLHVVGFALADEKTKDDMRQVATITGGSFFDAQDKKGLRKAMKEALSAPFDVLDTAGKRVASGGIGHGAIQVPEGIYTVKVHTWDRPITVSDVRVAPNRLTKVELKKVGQEIGTSVIGPLEIEEAGG